MWRVAGRGRRTGGSAREQNKTARRAGCNNNTKEASKGGRGAQRFQPVERTPGGRDQDVGGVYCFALVVGPARPYSSEPSAGSSSTAANQPHRLICAVLISPMIQATTAARTPPRYSTKPMSTA